MSKGSSQFLYKMTGGLIIYYASHILAFGQNIKKQGGSE
jgi:hypothetical protein